MRLGLVLMAGPIRVEYPGAMDHLLARGNQGRPLFRDDRDRCCFLETLAEAHSKTGRRILARVLMGNHSHHISGSSQPLPRPTRRGPQFHQPSFGSSFAMADMISLATSWYICLTRGLGQVCASARGRTKSRGWPYLTVSWRGRGQLRRLP